MVKEMIFVWPFLASFISKSDTSPRTTMRPMSSVIWFMGTGRSPMLLPTRASEGTLRLRLSGASALTDWASSASSRWRSSLMRAMRFSSSPVTTMRAVARMPNRSFNLSASMPSTLRDFKNAAPSSEDTHTVSTPFSRLQPLPFQSMKCMQPGLSCFTRDFMMGEATVTSFKTASRIEGYSNCTFTPTAGKAEAISRSTLEKSRSFNSVSLANRTRICPVFFDMLTRESFSRPASAASSRAIRSFHSSDMNCTSYSKRGKTHIRIPP